MRDSRETALTRAFVVGSPIKHSRSPLIHGYWLKRLGIAGSYQPLEVQPENFPTFVEALKNGSSGYSGGNVTIPHKEKIAALADRPDELCLELGAANTVWLQDGELFATNTDGAGFVSNLDERHPGWNAIPTAVVLGAGGASRAVIQALRDRGFKDIHVVNRTLARAQELADRFGAAIHAQPIGALAEVMQGAGLFVNTTSLGMDGEASPVFDFEPLAPGAVVTDIVYVPLVTDILRQAASQGFATVDGLGMLLHQAVPGFEKWFGARPVVTPQLRELVIRDMDGHR